MNLETQLREAGLTGNEAKVYYQLLQLGSSPANLLAKEVGLDRSLTYSLLNNLLEKGLVKHVTKNSKRFFEATSPENLLNPIKEKEALIQDLIPQLQKVKTLSKTVSSVSVYEGREGLKSMMKEFMKHNIAYGFGGTGKAYDIFYESPRWVKELNKKRMQLKLLMPKKYKGHTFSKASFAEVKFLDLESEATTTIFGDKIAIHTLAEKPFIVVIQNKHIAQSYKNHFEVLWKQGRK